MLDSIAIYVPSSQPNNQLSNIVRTDSVNMWPFFTLVTFSTINLYSNNTILTLYCNNAITPDRWKGLKWPSCSEKQALLTAHVKHGYYVLGVWRGSSVYHYQISMESLCFKTEKLSLYTCKLILPKKTSSIISADVLSQWCLWQTATSSSPATWSTVMVLGGAPHTYSWHGLLSFWSQLPPSPLWQSNQFLSPSCW